ncbi:MAG: hypothetical protein AAFR36_01190 [Bacteroidota bacterium]
MEKSTVYQLITHFSKRELASFRQWIRSPFFNEDQAQVRLWDYLQECYEYLQVSPNKRKAFTKAYPTEEFSDQKMRLLMSRLNKQLEQFLAYQSFENGPFSDLHLAKALRQRRALRHFHRVSTRMAKKLNQTPLRNETYFRQQLALQEEAHNLLSVDDPTEAGHLKEMATHLDCAYLVERLRQSCRILAHKRVYQAGEAPDPIPLLLPYATEFGYTQEPAVRLYINCYRMLLQGAAEEHFQAFKDDLLQNGACVSLTELRDLYLLAINYCIRQVNSNQISYYQDLLALYRKGLASSALLEKGVLSRFTYQNAVTAGIRMQEYDWVEQFIRKYQAALEKPYRDIAFNICMARLEFSRGNYEQALGLVESVNYRDPLLNLGNKVLQLKIYYEAGNIDALEAQLDAMSTYIRRKQIIGYHRSNYEQIVRYVRKLITTNPYDKEALEALLQAVKTEQPLTERHWLEKKIEALI